jgi:hypothetical protein
MRVHYYYFYPLIVVGMDKSGPCPKYHCLEKVCFEILKFTILRYYGKVVEMRIEGAKTHQTGPEAPKS